MKAADVTIEPATTPEDLAAVRELCWAYRAYLRDFAPAERRITEVFYPEAKYAARGHGIARRLCERLIEQAAEDGFDRVVLDTSRAFTAARNLYVSLGFHETGPYQPIPNEMLPHLCFFERNLNTAAS